MTGKFFLDTNIFVYPFDDRQPHKGEIARRLISEALQTGSGLVSWQVMQEFINVSTRKFAVPLKPADVSLYLEKVLHPLCQVFPDLDLYRSAIDIQEQTRYSFYDALIVAAALRGGCTRLYSEDLQPGRLVGKLEIRNPFE